MTNTYNKLVHILASVGFVVALFTLLEATVQADTTESTPEEHLSVGKAELLQQQHWTTKAESLKSLVAQGDDSISETPWSNSIDQKEAQEVLFELQQLQRRNFAPDRGAPSFTIANPYGFGTDRGKTYIGIGFTPNTRFGDDDADGVIGFGVGLGNAQKAVGLELNYSLASLGFNRDFGTGGFSAKMHRVLVSSWGIAAGWNGFLNTGDNNDFEDSVYLTTTKIFATREKLNSAFSRMAITVGVGNGQFRTERAIETNDESFNFFGSLAFRVARPVSGIIEWTGQDLALGASVSPFKRIPVTFNLAVRDIVGAGDGARFVMGFGTGLGF